MPTPVLKLEDSQRAALAAVALVAGVDLFAEVLGVGEEELQVVGVEPGAELVQLLFHDPLAAAEVTNDNGEILAVIHLRLSSRGCAVEEEVSVNQEFRLHWELIEENEVEDLRADDEPLASVTPRFEVVAAASSLASSFRSLTHRR